MAIRPATESDVPVVRSLLRAYCDFYAASPSESSLERMVWALIAAPAEIARRHGAPAVTWLTREENYRARAVYDRAGGRSEPFLEYELKISPGAGPVGARPGKASGQSAAAQA